MISGGRPVTPRSREPLEVPQVEPVAVAVHPQQIAGRACLDALGSGRQHAPQFGDVRLHERACGVRWLVAPDRVDQCSGGDHPPRPQQQRGQQRAGFGPAERKTASTGPDFHRAEQSVLQAHGAPVSSVARACHMLAARHRTHPVYGGSRRTCESLPDLLRFRRIRKAAPHPGKGPDARIRHGLACGLGPWPGSRA